MTALSETNRYRINGVIDTSRPVIENIENICNSCMSWFTYDNTTGKWGVIINREETSAHSFSDDNIVGAISVGTRGVEDLYNSVEVNFPDIDLLDVNNTREHTIPSNLQITNEEDRQLKLAYNLVSDQVRAQNLSRSELWQSRTDLTCRFATNYSMNDLEIGDVIDITNNTYSWTNKLFRVTNIREEDTAEGNIVYSITASEYRSDIYNHISLRETEDPADGINTIANIGLLTNPVISKGEVEEKPFFQFETTIPGTGSPITGIELWAYKITDPAELLNWNDTVAYPDATRAYDLVFTKRPVEDDYYTPGASWSARSEDFAAGDYLFKLRPVNATTKGAFTDYLTTGVVTFAPKVSEGVINTISNETLNFRDVIANYATSEIAIPAIVTSGVPVTQTSNIGRSLVNPSRALLFTWEALFTPSGSPAYDPATINQVEVEVIKNGTIVLENEVGRTAQIGYAQGNYCTLSGITFFLPSRNSQGTNVGGVWQFDVGDVFEFRVTATSTGTNISDIVDPTFRLEYFSL